MAPGLEFLNWRQGEQEATMNEPKKLEEEIMAKNRNLYVGGATPRNGRSKYGMRVPVLSVYMWASSFS